MPAGSTEVVPAGLPDVHRERRASRRGRITGALEVRLVLDVIGPPYYPSFAGAAVLLARCDARIGERTSAGATFPVVAGEKPA